MMNKKLLKEKWSYITIFSFLKCFSEPCISEMIHLFYIFWDRRISVIFAGGGDKQFQILQNLLTFAIFVLILVYFYP